ncbi:unnamed protein product, partial [Coccothraustes coccothraustes]
QASRQQRRSPTAAPEEHHQEAPQSPQQHSQHNTGRRTQMAVPAWHRASVARMEQGPRGSVRR